MLKNISYYRIQETTTLMDNTLLRLINGEIDKKDCLDRLSLYNIQFNQSYYTIFQS